MQNSCLLSKIKNTLCTGTMITTICILLGCGDKPTPPQIEPSKLFEQERFTLEKAKDIAPQLNKKTEQVKQDVEKQVQ
jgi:hypothetical protein